MVTDQSAEPERQVPALLLDKVVKTYGPIRAVDGVSFKAHAGEFIALLGPNGAGKSTLFQLLSGLFTADSGRIEVMGHDMSRDPVPALAELGIVFQQPTLDLELSVTANLLFHAGLHGIPRATAEQRIAGELARLGLAERGVAVLWATHLCDEVTDADRVIVMHRGNILADTSPAELVAKAGTATIEQAFLAMTGTGPKSA